MISNDIMRAGGESWAAPSKISSSSMCDAYLFFPIPSVAWRRARKQPRPTGAGERAEQVVGTDDGGHASRAYPSAREAAANQEREGFTHAGDGHWTAVEPSFNE